MLLVISRTGIFVAFERSLVRALSWTGSRCWISTKDIPVSTGRCCNNSVNASSPPAEAPIATTGNETALAFTDSLSAFWPLEAMRVGSDSAGDEDFLAAGLFLDLGLFSLTIMGISVTGVAIVGNSSAGIAIEQGKGFSFAPILPRKAALRDKPKILDRRVVLI